MKTKYTFNKQDITSLLFLFSALSTTLLFSQSSTVNPEGAKTHRLEHSTRGLIMHFNKNGIPDIEGRKNEDFFFSAGPGAWYDNVRFRINTNGTVSTNGGMFAESESLYLVADWNNNSTKQDIVFGFDASSVKSVKEKMRLTDEGLLGIGTRSPKGKLHVNGDIYAKGHTFYHANEGDGKSGTAYIQARDKSNSTNIALQLRTQKNGKIVEALKVTSDGNVGIGTESPTVKLDVNGIARFSDDVTLEKDIAIKGDITSFGTLDIKKEINFSSVLNSQQVIVNKGVDFKLTNISGSHFAVKNAFGSDALYIKTDGKVGFGAINPNNITEQMHVVGRIKASGFIADASSFPDYVFAKDYNLMPLQDIKKYTEKHHSLPGMPSEKEVTTNGLDVKKVVTVSVEKIEELYLHLIQQQETILKLEQRLQKLEQSK